MYTPDMALAGLRIYLGVMWLAYGTSKFESDWASGKQEFLSAVSFASKSTGEPFKTLLVNFVIPHQAVFAQLVAFGESLVAISLLLGLLTKFGAAGSMFLSATYYLATGRYTSHFGVESIELLILVVSLYLLITPSGRYLSLDRILVNAVQRRFRATS